jgi:hypothetical protein
MTSPATISEGAEVFSYKRQQRLLRHTPTGPPIAVESGIPAPTFAGPRMAGTAPARDGKDLFYCFQLNPSMEGGTIIESSQVVPTLAGEEGKTDVYVKVDMLAFHVGDNEGIDHDTKATLRLNIGKDDNSTDTRFDKVLWAVAAGMNLYDDVRKGRSGAKELGGSFDQALGKRPIEVPGGLAELSFEVVKHKEPQWWQKLFKFIGGPTGKSLVSLLGFPAVAVNALGIIDDALSRLEGKPEVLFKGARVPLALTKSARDQFVAGYGRVALGALNPGVCILARGRDFSIIADAKATFYASYGRLVPNSVPPEKIPQGSFDDPFANVTYAVLRVGMQGARFDPAFNYGG